MSDGSPLYVLVICSRPLIDFGGRPLALLDMAEERRRIETAVNCAGNLAHIHFLPEATTGKVQAALREDWNVVHFTGHGTTDGGLLLEDGFGVAQLLTRHEIAQLLSGQERTPLLVLSACYSERVGLELHAAGLPAVVAVDARVPIADLAAIIFAEHFYAGLARAWDVQRAFDDAKRAVALDASVGDSKAPQDARGRIEEPWSRRFKLIGAAPSMVAATRAHGHRDTGPLNSVNRNLPPRSANFVGRAKEIVDVIKAFDEAESQRVCVYGSGGLGKTELAKAVARWYIERARVAAVLWASGSPVEGEHKLRDLASLLGIAARVFRLPITEQSMFDEQKTVVRDFLAAQRAFVLLDNWETIEPQHRRELWNFILSLPDTVRVLVTSRDVLPPRDARNIELDALAPKDAAELFLKTARNAGYFDRDPHLRAEEMAILDSICERLNGYPLAIEVVAGQTLSRTLDEIWADFQRVPQNVLEGQDELTGESRGLWTSLGLSYNALSPLEQALFGCMCIFLSPASDEDVAAVAMMGDPRPMLDSLVKRSLVRAREGAYYLSPIVRDYAESKLIEAGQDPQGGHTFAYNYYSQKGTPEGALAASDHLFELASRFQSREAGELFIEYLDQFYRGLVTQGYWAEARSKTEQWIRVARAIGDKEQEAQAIGELGTRYFQVGEYDRAGELLRTAQSIFEQFNNKDDAAVSLYHLALLAEHQGNYAEAAGLYEQSLKVGEELGNKRVIALALNGLANIQFDHGDYPGAERLYRQSLEIKEASKDQGGIATSLHGLGNIQVWQGNHEDAGRLYKESLEIKTELGDKGGVAGLHHQLGVLAATRGDYSEAARLYRKSLEIFEELEDKLGIATTLHQLGKLNMQQGGLDEAALFYRQSLDIQEELGDKNGMASTLEGLAVLAQHQSDYGAAERLYRKSLQIKEELGVRSEVAHTLGRMGQFYRAQGRVKEALDCALRSLAICEELHLPSREVALMDIEKVRDAVGAEQLREWLKEFSTEGERISRWLEWRAVGNQTWTRDFVEHLLTALPQAVVSARQQGHSPEQSALAQQLMQLEVGAQVQGQPELADFLFVLRGLLAGEDVRDKVATLSSPLKEIVEQTRATLE